MAIQYRTGSNWKTVASVKVRVSGVWRDVPQAYVKTSSGWKPVFEYEWQVGAWSGCTVECDGGTQTREVRCWCKTTNSFVDDAFCTLVVGSKPDTSRVCNTQSCLHEVTPPANLGTPAKLYTTNASAWFEPGTYVFFIVGAGGNRGSNYNYTYRYVCDQSCDETCEEECHNERDCAETCEETCYDDDGCDETCTTDCVDNEVCDENCWEDCEDVYCSEPRSTSGGNGGNASYKKVTIFLPERLWFSGTVGKTPGSSSRVLFSEGFDYTANGGANGGNATSQYAAGTNAPNPTIVYPHSSLNSYGKGSGTTTWGQGCIAVWGPYL